MTSQEMIKDLVEFGMKLEDLEREYFKSVLLRSEFNKAKAARIAGSSVRTIFNKIHEYDIEQPQEPEVSDAQL